MGDKKETKEKKIEFKCFKCLGCEHYSNKNDFCKARHIEYCSKKVPTEFSQCDDYLIKESLIMF